MASKTRCFLAPCLFRAAWRVGHVVLLAICVIPVGTCGAGQQDVVSRLTAAADAFQPVGEAEVRLAKKQVRDALREVEQVLERSPKHAAGWEKYLLLNEQLRQLSQHDALDMGLWKRVHGRLACNESDLEKRSFQHLRTAVKNLIQTAEAARHPNLEKAVRRCVRELIDALPEEESLSSQEVRELSQRLERLAKLRQVPELVRDIREKYLHPNLRVTVPESLVQRLFREEIDEPYEYRQNVAGAVVRGDGRLRALMSASLGSDHSKGAVQLKIEGSSDSDTVSYQDGVWIATDNSLQFHSASTLSLTAAGFSLTPFKSTGTLDNPITNIWSRYRFWRARRARRKAFSRHYQRKGEATRTALNDVDREFTVRVGERLSELDQYYQQQARLPLLRYGAFPKMMRFSSDSEKLELRASFANQQQLAAPPKTLTLDVKDAVRLFCHESVINNTAPAILGGRTRSLSTVLRSLTMDETPDAAEKRALRVTFADSNPLRVRFAADEITVELTGTSYTYEYQGESVEAPEGIGIVLRYALESSKGGWRLVLDDDPEIDLPLSGLRAVARRRILTNILARDLPATVKLQRMTPRPPFQRLGSFAPKAVRLKQGWLAVGLRPIADPDD
ncbi:MAG: hypothetical protein ACQESR_20320 [Planctomycetota bacterium]